jgi:hypothetical protein
MTSSRIVEEAVDLASEGRVVPWRNERDDPPVDAHVTSI